MVGELLVGIPERRRSASVSQFDGRHGSGTPARYCYDFVTGLAWTISEALRSLELFPLLNGPRGRQRADVDAAVDAVEKFAQFPNAK